MDLRLLHEISYRKGAGEEFEYGAIGIPPLRCYRKERSIHNFGDASPIYWVSPCMVVAIMATGSGRPG